MYNEIVTIAKQENKHTKTIWTVMGAELGYNGLHSHVGNLICG